MIKYMKKGKSYKKFKMLIYSKVYCSHGILKVIMAKVVRLKLQKHGWPADISGNSGKGTFQEAQIMKNDLTCPERKDHTRVSLPVPIQSRMLH